MKETSRIGYETVSECLKKEKETNFTLNTMK